MDKSVGTRVPKRVLRLLEGLLGTFTGIVGYPQGLDYTDLKMILEYLPHLTHQIASVLLGLLEA